MHNHGDSTDRIELSKAEVRNLHLLFSKLYDQDITEEELTVLNKQLEESSTARWHYLRFTSLHNSILTSSGKLKQVETEAMRQRVIDAAVETEDHVIKTERATVAPKVMPLASSNGRLKSSSNNSSSNNFATFSFISTVAVLFLLAGSWIVWDRMDPGNQSLVALKDAVKTEQSFTKVALISNFPSSAVWQCNNQLPASSQIVQGDSISLESGEIELTYLSGTKLVLIGPAEFSVESEGGMLVKGGLIASVTEAGHGFTINTPNGKIVDLGTEFGVAVDDFGVSEVSVFKGKVEAFPVSRHSSQKKHELSKGEGIQWDKEVVTFSAADIRRFTNNRHQLTNPVDNKSYQAQIALNFSEDAFEEDAWQTVGKSEIVKGELLLSAASDQMRPYLITSEQYDPSNGAVTVECEFHFKETKNETTPSIAILTRCSNQRGVAWDKGLIESCVRSNYSIENTTEGGILSTGLKLEGNRELTDIIGSGFLNPTKNQTYKLVLEDDGVNIKCQISLKECPWISKSVTCRSLFRGPSNYIAFEGDVDGLTVIEKVSIRQRSQESLTFDYSEYASTLLGQKNLDQLSDDALNSIIPAGQSLIMKEDFESGTLNQGFWKTLGHAVVENGHLQLGASNSAEHIDTWRARPYLLTKESFNPSKLSVTIIGKVTFADNFRSGYGASFAVMTRSSKQRGQGPGWEYSILQKCLRSNFWPAAWAPDHCLEIHERADENAILLLSKKEFAIDPTAQTYVFRVIDSSEKISLTIIDPRNPDHSETIESEHHNNHSNGTIGFESCWGSPVLLDDLHIYQATP